VVPVLMVRMMLVVPAVPVVSAARDAQTAAHAAAAATADAPPEPIPATGARPPSAAQTTGQHKRQHRAHGEHRRQYHVVHGLRFHRACKTTVTHRGVIIMFPVRSWSPVAATGAGGNWHFRRFVLLTKRARP